MHMLRDPVDWQVVEETLFSPDLRQCRVLATKFFVSLSHRDLVCMLLEGNDAVLIRYETMRKLKMVERSSVCSIRSKDNSKV